MAATLLDQVEWDPRDACWRWGSARVCYRGRCYGQVRVDGEQQLAHRAAYAEWIGKVPKGATIGHRCGVSLCINPLHLELKTKRKPRPPRRAKLTRRIAELIRRELSGTISQREIARRFGVSQTAIWLICEYRTYWP